MSRYCRLAVAGFLLSGPACGQRPGIDGADLYAVLLRSRHQGAHEVAPLALQPRLMSDSGTYDGEGQLAPATITYLQSQRLITEVCRTEAPESAVPDCLADSASTAVRFSRPIPDDSGTVSVYVGVWAVRPGSDTTGDIFVPFGTTELCRIAKEGASWRVVSCQKTMIT